MSTIKLIGIARVSTAAQATDDRFGYARQEHSIRQVAAGQPDATLVEPIVRVCISGTSLDLSPEWLDIILPAIKDPNTHVVVDHQDRLVRSDIGSTDVGVLMVLRETKTLIYTPHGTVDLNDPQDAMIAAILSAVSGYERHRIRVRCEAAKRAAARAGRYPEGVLPFGIHYDKETHEWSQTPDAEIVRLVFRLYVENVPISEIARRVARPQGTIYSWLNTVPLYNGYLEYKGIRTQVFGGDGQPEPVIDAETWRRTQRRIQGGRQIVRRGRDVNAERYPYSGFLYARQPTFQPGLKKNPYKMRGGSSQGRRRHYAPFDFSCGIGAPLSEPLNKGVDAYLVALSKDEDYAAALRGSTGHDEGQREVERAALVDALQKIQAKLRRLANLYIDGVLDRAHLDTKRKSLEKDQAKAEAALADLDAASEEGVDPERVEEVIEGLRVFRADWSGSKKRQWLQRYCKGITISRDAIESVVLRIPGSTMPAFIGGPRVKWHDLEVGPWNSAEWRRRTTGLMSNAEAAEALGTTPRRLLKWVQAGRVPAPATRQERGKAAPMLRWTDEEVAAIKASSNAYPIRKSQSC